MLKCTPHIEALHAVNVGVLQALGCMLKLCLIVQVQAVCKGMADAVAGQRPAKHCSEAAIAVMVEGIGVAEWLAGSRWLLKEIAPRLLPERVHYGPVQGGTQWQLVRADVPTGLE